MREQFGDYLLRDISDVPVRKNDPNFTKAVVWLEDEKSFWVEPVLKNFSRHLSNDFNFYFFCTDKNYEFVCKKVAALGWDITVKKIQDILPEVPPQMSADTFNYVYKHPAWWSFFNEAHILTAQLDTILLQPWDDKWLKFDMIGAPCNVETFNGGLCLRNRKKMLECLGKDSTFEINRFVPEDVFFTHSLRHFVPSVLPTREEATAFSIENFPTNVKEFCSQPFGIHGTNKYYMQDSVIEALLSKKDFKIITKQKPNVFLCSPVYKWPPHPKFQESVAKCQADPRMNIVFRAVSGDAHIERARSMLLEQYLRYEEPWDWMVMIDSDIEFNPDILWGIINRGKDCIGAAYPFKAPEGNPKHKQPVIRPLSPDEPIQEGQLRIKYLGGGFTICSDKMIKKLCDEYKELKFYVNPDIKQGDGSGRTYGLWNPVLVPQPDWGLDEDGNPKMEMLSEDYSFCQRILDMGEDVWLDLCAVIAHWDGDKFYTLETTSLTKEQTNG